MKMITRLSLLAILLLTSFAGQLYAEIDGLGRSWAKLEQDKKLTIGYFGGSITAGAGASKAGETSWRALTTAWFRTQFPQAQITEINAAIGGTGSDFGAFRCQRDLLDKKPDLVFVEFAVNDQGAAAKSKARFYEGVIRQIKYDNPTTDIILVYTVTKTGDVYPQNQVPPSVESEHEIGVYYGLPEINVGQALSQAIQQGKGTWDTMTTDGTHPNDSGYRIYADTVIDFLKNHLKDVAALPAALPKPLNEKVVDKGRMIDAWETEATGWEKENQSIKGVYPHYLSSNKPGSEITFKFRGTIVGLLWFKKADSGMIEYTIDDGAPKTASSWDKYCLKFDRASYAILNQDLTDAEHTLKIKVSEQKDAESTGTAIRIGAFLVH